MNEELQKALADLIQKAVDVGDFAVDQAPAIVQQLLMWGLMYNSMLVGAGLLCLGFVALYVYCADRALRRSSTTDLEDIALGGGLVFAVVAILLGIGLLARITEVVKILVAPDIYLLEYAAGLL